MPAPAALALGRHDVVTLAALFSLGVSSGNHSVVVWTRLANDPLGGGGMSPVRMPVH